MGLHVYCQDVEIWYGAYSAFHRWRSEIAKLSGVPSLELMEGFFQYNFQFRVLENATETTNDKNDYMKLYTRKNRNDVIVKVTFDHIKHLDHKVIEYSLDY